MMRSILKIPEEDWNNFNCILVLPDVFVRKHIKSLISTLFTKLYFKKMYVHLESIMACFGTAVTSACVVDIGHEKISICCVDEGIILPKSLVRKNFGCKDLSKGIVKMVNERINSDEIDQF